MTFGLESIEFGVSFLLPIIPKSNWENVSGETRNCVRVKPGTDGLYQWCCVTYLKVPSSGTSSNFDGTGTELVPFQKWWNLA